MIEHNMHTYATTVVRSVAPMEHQARLHAFSRVQEAVQLDGLDPLPAALLLIGLVRRGYDGDLLQVVLEARQ